MNRRTARPRNANPPKGKLPLGIERNEVATKSRSVRDILAANRPQLSLAALLLSGLLALLGIFMLRSNSLAFGGTAILVGIAGLLIASKQLNAVDLSMDGTRELMRAWLPVSLPILALFLSAMAAQYVAQPQTPTVSKLAVICWISSLACFAAGILWIQHWRAEPGAYAQWIGSNRAEVLVLTAILIASAATRFYALDAHPYPPAFDEATVGLEGERVVSPNSADLFSAGWSGNPNLAFYPSGIAVSTLGNSILAVRAVSAIIGILTVLFLYLLARELFDSSIALMAAAFLVAFPFHLQFSRLGVLTIQDGLVVTLALWLVMRAVRHDRLSGYMWAGIATGLTLSAYVGGRLVMALAIAALVLVAIRRRGWLRSHALHIGVYAAATLITLAPMAVYFVQHPQVFNSRLGQVSIIESGWLTRELAAPGKSLGGILMNQFSSSTLVYVASGAYGNFFNSPQPYLTLVGSLFFLIGMGVAFQHILQVPFMLLLAWFWAVILSGGVLTVGPPANTRVVMSIPAVALFVALGIQKLLEILGRAGVSKASQTATSAGILLFLLVQNTAFYFGTYRAGNYFDDLNAELMLKVGLQLRSLGPQYTLYLMGLPRVSTRFPTIQFLDPANAEQDLDVGQASGSDFSPKLPAIMAATPDNLAALQALAQRLPDGTMETVPCHSGHDPLYYGYIMPAAAGP